MSEKRRLRIYFNSNSQWSPSGYGQQISYLAPLIRDAGFELAMGDFYGLEGGSIEWGGIKQYPKIDHAYGEDGIFYHANDFNADVVMTLQDIWVLNPDVLNKIKCWIPFCLDGDTVVDFVDGRSLKISDVVANKIEGEVFGYKDGKVVRSKILAWQDIPEKMDVFEIKTKDKTLLITGNNDVFVNGKWKRADCIEQGDVIYCMCNTPHEILNEQTNTKGDGVGLSGRNTGWGGNDQYNESSKEESPSTHNTSNDIGGRNRRDNDKLAGREDIHKGEQQASQHGEQVFPPISETNKGNKDMLSGATDRVQLPSDTIWGFTLSDSEKEASRDRNRVLRAKIESLREEVQSSLHDSGDRFMGTGEGIEPQVVVAIRKVDSPKRRVFDISTETGNFFANKILVHNCPIDHDPIPPAIYERLRIAYRIVTMSEFGEKQLSDRGMHSTQIPHFVDTEIFKPMNKAESKKMLTIPEDYYVFGMVSANKENPPRKSFQEAMDAFKLFHDIHPKSCMYFHTHLTQPGGFDIEQYARFLGINGFVYKIDLYQQRFKCDKPQMARIFNAFDVLLMPSTNEGFGIPAIEAQSCGVPVITNDFTSMPELIIPGKTGELCKVLYKRFTPLGSYIGVPDHKSIYDCMEKIYKGDWNAYSKAARKHVIDKYELHKVWDTLWLPFLLKVEQELLGDLSSSK